MNTVTYIQGTTYLGMSITIKVNDIPLDLTNATITATFENSSNAKKVLTAGRGITDIDVLGGSFKLLENTVVNWEKGTWVLTVTTVLNTGDIKKYIYKNVEFVII